MLLLLKNHKVKRKDDRKITKRDLRDSKYILIDTATELQKSSKNYVMVDPSKIPWFTKAKIVYQMLFLYDDIEVEISGWEGIPPVETETNSLSDVINLLNCIDRLYISNQLICNDQYRYTDTYIVIGYFEVTLYDGDKKVYHKLYENKSNFDERFGKEVKFPLKAVKKFHDIYNTDIIRNLSIMNEFVYIHKDMTWSQSVIDSNFLLIGIPLLGSRTITLLTDQEYLKVMNIRGMTVSYNIIWIYDQKQKNHINHSIEIGDYDEVGLGNHEYIIASIMEYGRTFSVPYRFVYLDIFSHITFVLRLTTMIYYYVEGFEDSCSNDGDGVSSIVSIDIYENFKTKEKTRTLMMNEDTTISLDKTLSLL